MTVVFDSTGRPMVPDAPVPVFPEPAAPVVETVAPSARRERFERMARQCAIAGFLLALCWCAHFTRSARMGFYEDDHYFAVEVLTWKPLDAVKWTWTQIHDFPLPQGRPIGFVLGRVLPYIGYLAGGVPGMYVVAWLVFSTNAILLYQLLRRCLPAPMPIIGAIAFIFFPPDTTRPFLCHADILQPSFTFTLLACHFYLSRQWKWWALAYLFALCALLTYETALLPFIFFPLLQKRWNLRWVGTFALHWISLALVIGLLFSVRKMLGEARAVDAHENIHAIIDKVRQGTVIGIETTARMCGKRAQQGFNDFIAHSERDTWRNMLVIAIALGSAVVISTLFTRLSQRPRSTRVYLLDLGRATAFGLAALSISYLFCFTHFPPDFEEGRMTSTHLAATIPVAVLMAVIASVPMLISPRSTGMLIAAEIVMVYFTLLYASAIDEQAGYVSIWQARCHFWTQAFDLCPDMTDRTLIVCDGGTPRPAWYMDGSSWSEYMVAYQCYQFPAAFSRRPMGYAFRPDAAGPTWRRDAILTSDGKITWKPNPFDYNEPVQTVDDGNLILLHCDDAGNMTRDHGTVTLAGKVIHLRDLPPAGTRSPYPTLPLYHLMTGRPATASW